jgi:hypothetical protein
VEVEMPDIPEHLSPDELEAIKPTLEQLSNENEAKKILDNADRLSEILEIEKKLYQPFFDSLKILAEKENDKIAFWINEKGKYLSGISTRTFAVSGIISRQIQSGPILMDRLIDIEIERLQSLQANNPPKALKGKPAIEKVNPLSLIHRFRLRELNNYEAILKDRIFLWKDEHKAKAECAAFCDYLNEKNFFINDKKERVKNGRLFAFNKYGIDITIQLKKDETIRKPNIAKIERILRQG